jgi:hypothetical protein
MITTLAAVLLCSVASANPAPAMPGAPTPAAPAAAPQTSAPQASAPQPPKPQAPSSRRRDAPVPAVSTSSSTSAADVLGVSTYTVATLYTGDKVRDPFLPPSVGGGSVRARDRNAPVVVDIHALELRGIMKDGSSDFAIFSTDMGTSLVLRGRFLYDDHNKRVPGITGRIKLKQKRAELVTADKDVQIYSLGESEADKAKESGSDDDETQETGSGRSP